MEQGERVDVTIHGHITNVAYSLTLSPNLYIVGIVKKAKCLHYCMHSNSEIKQCTASVNVPIPESCEIVW